jgi:hypothetical protein
MACPQKFGGQFFRRSSAKPWQNNYPSYKQKSEYILSPPGPLEESRVGKRQKGKLGAPQFFASNEN